MPAPDSTATEPLRFAHPFFTDTPPAARAAGPGGLTRMLDFIQQRLQPIPKPRGESVMALADIIGAAGVQEIVASGKLVFHSVGDTGRGTDSPQEDVAEAMARDFDVAQPGKSPAFFFHLGDVIYGPGKDGLYRTEFYEPYRHYPGKIIAIPGNHDGEVFPNTDPETLKAFAANFCTTTPVVPPIAGTIFRQTMNLPGVYWMLDAPFAHVIGLYSNAAENPGFISGPIPGDRQKLWLVKRLKAIKAERDAGQRKALVVATHHPPYTSGGHGPSTVMLADIDDAFTLAKMLPDLFLSGHSHNYQRYTRKQTLAGTNWQIPYIVAGCGGRNNSSVPPATGQTVGDHTYVKSRKGFGFLRLTASADKLIVKCVSVDGTTIGEFDSLSVDLGHHTTT